MPFEYEAFPGELLRNQASRIQHYLFAKQYRCDPTDPPPVDPDPPTPKPEPEPEPAARETVREAVERHRKPVQRHTRPVN